jgi:hypothetical protein
MHNIPKEKMYFGTKFWTEINFYDNQKIKSTGIIITGIYEPQANQYKIGTWFYYNSRGQLSNKETIFSIK